MRTAVVDLFSGIGGLSYGFKQEGFSVKAGVDSDASCRFAFETNVGAQFISKDIRTLKSREVALLLDEGDPDYKIVIGCAPCAPFSPYTRRYRKAKRRDRERKWALLKEFTRIVSVTKPDVVSMENVPRLQRHGVFRQFINRLQALGYTVTYYRVRSENYGVPQRRSRLVVFASLYGAVDIIPETHAGDCLTVREVIGGLPKITAGIQSKGDPLHVSRRLTEKNLARLRATREGGSWKEWPSDLQLACHKKRKGKSFRSVYGRMKWDAVGPVITTQCLGIGNGRFGHPEQDRAISIREAALLQTFPKNFKFVPPRTPAIGVHLARQIGNAVPVRLGRIIARSIKRHLSAVHSQHASKPA
jgi:DNA (cytosine-5)-methyltransferase 1